MYKSKHHFRKLSTPVNPVEKDLQSPRKFNLTGANTHSYAWPQAHSDPRLNTSILRKYARNFRTWKIPGDSTASNLQDPKISGPKTLPRTSTRRQKSRRSQPQLYMPTNATLIKSSAPTCHVHPRASVVWCHWWRRQTRFDPLILTRTEPPPKKKKKSPWPWLTLTKKSKFSKPSCPT